MEPEEVLFRALGVPGFLTPNGRVLAAGARLREAAGLTDPKVWPPDEEATVEMTRLVLITVVAALRDGTLDPLLGDYGGEEPSRVVRRVAGDLRNGPGFLSRFDAQCEPLVQASVEKLLTFRNTQPDLGWSTP